MAIAKKRPQDLRREARRTINEFKPFPGVAKLGNGKTIEIFPTDVSPRGVGFSVQNEILPEMSVFLEIGSVKVELGLRWGILDVKNQSYRYGFELESQDNINLDQLFKSHGIN